MTTYQLKASESGHETREECYEAKDYLHADGNKEIVDHGHNVDVIYTCPTCGRKWEYVHDFVGVWDPEAEEYFREGSF